nr:MAG TPA: hypothetical protein [Caudoviricetes sp.]
MLVVGFIIKRFLLLKKVKYETNKYFLTSTYQVHYYSI